VSKSAKADLDAGVSKDGRNPMMTSAYMVRDAPLARRSSP